MTDQSMEKNARPSEWARFIVGAALVALGIFFLFVSFEDAFLPFIVLFFYGFDLMARSRIVQNLLAAVMSRHRWIRGLLTVLALAGLAVLLLHLLQVI